MQLIVLIKLLIKWNIQFINPHFTSNNSRTKMKITVSYMLKQMRIISKFLSSQAKIRGQSPTNGWSLQPKTSRQSLSLLYVIVA